MLMCNSRNFLTAKTGFFLLLTLQLCARHVNYVWKLCQKSFLTKLRPFSLQISVFYKVVCMCVIKWKKWVPNKLCDRRYRSPYVDQVGSRRLLVRAKLQQVRVRGVCSIRRNTPVPQNVLLQQQQQQIPAAILTTHPMALPRMLRQCRGSRLTWWRAT